MFVLSLKPNPFVAEAGKGCRSRYAGDAVHASPHSRVLSSRDASAGSVIAS